MQTLGREDRFFIPARYFKYPTMQLEFIKSILMNKLRELENNNNKPSTILKIHKTKYKHKAE